MTGKTKTLGSEPGQTPLKRLRPTSVERFLTHLRGKGLSDSSVRQIYTVARAVGDAAVRDGLLGLNPFTVVRRPRVRVQEAGFLTPAQVSELLSAAQGSRYRPLLELLVHTGLRRGEALALQWRDLDLKKRTLRVRGTLAVPSASHGYREQDHGVLDSLEGVPRVGDGHEVAGRSVPPVLARDQRDAAVQDLDGRFPRVLVLVEVRAGTEGDQGLAEYVFMTSVDRVGAATARRGRCRRQVMTDQCRQGFLLHGLSSCWTDLR